MLPNHVSAIIIDSFPVAALADLGDLALLRGVCRAWRDAIDAALRAAFSDCGVNVSSYTLDLDLDGKRYEVLHHAAKRLGNPLRTVADLKRLLR